MTATGTLPERRAWVEQVMGMPVSIHLRGTGSRSPRAEGPVVEAYAGLRVVDALFSTYRPDSEVSRIRRGELDLGDAHPRVQEVAALCRVAAESTGGLFDAWHSATFDPTGLVKGWAVQRTADRLAEQVPGDVSVNAGGDVAVRAGRDPSPWRIGVEDPRDTSGVLCVLSVTDGAVATSGSARRGLHLVDPRDGSASDGLLSVTVSGPSLLWADVLATAAFVAGADALAVVAAHPGYAALVVGRDATWSSPGLPVAAGRA